MDENVNVTDLKFITTIVSDNFEIWVEKEGKKFPIYDYDWELEEGRIVLKG